MSEKTKPKTITVKLLKAHTHAGMQYDAGFELELLEHDAIWLKNLKIAEDVKTTSATTPKNEEK